MTSSTTIPAPSFRWTPRDISLFIFPSYLMFRLAKASFMFIYCYCCFWTPRLLCLLINFSLLFFNALLASHPRLFIIISLKFFCVRFGESIVLYLVYLLLLLYFLILFLFYCDLFFIFSIFKNKNDSFLFSILQIFISLYLSAVRITTKTVF